MTGVQTCALPIFTTNAGKCNVDIATNALDECSDCPIYCRQYFSDIKDDNGDWMMINADSPDCDTNACNTCLEKIDSIEQSPDCMLGVPAIRYKNCNDDNLCGRALPLSEIASIDNDGNIEKILFEDVCPLECRVIYSPGDEQYKDPAYFKYCVENPKIKKACTTTCPD